MATRTLRATSLGSGSVSELSESYFYESDPQHKSQRFFHTPNYGAQLHKHAPAGNVSNVIMLPIPGGLMGNTSQKTRGPSHKLNMLEKSLLGRVVMETRRQPPNRPRGEMPTLALLQQMSQNGSGLMARSGEGSDIDDPSGRKNMMLASRLSRQTKLYPQVNDIPVGTDDFHLPFLNKYDGLSSPLNVQLAPPKPPPGPRQAAPSRVDVAMATVRRLKTIWREDVPKGAPRARPHSDTQTSLGSADPHGSRGVGVLGTPQDDNQATGTVHNRTHKHDTKRGAGPIKGHYKFPKIADFISGEPTHIEGAGVEFKVPTSRGFLTSDPTAKQRSSDRSRSCDTKSAASLLTSYAQSFKSSNKPKNKDNNTNNGSTSTIPGQRCRTFYPVAEAMRRENTATECLRGRPLGQGDWKVSKVWQRDLQDVNQLLPIQAAREDISDSLLSRQREARQADLTAHSSVQLDGSTMSRDSLSDDLSSVSDDRNDMYTILEEEEE